MSLDRVAPSTVAVEEVLQKPRKLRVSLRLSLLTVTVITVVISALATHLPWLFISGANVQDMANQLSEEIVKGVRRELNDMFASAYADQRKVGDLFATKTIALDDVTRREALFLSFIKANRYYSFVALGMENGDFYGAQRKDDANILTINSVYNTESKRATRTERSYVGNGREYSFFREATKENDYTSTARSWYQLARKSPQTDVLTEPYIFANTGQPGVNTATTLDVDGKTVGVVNIAIEFSRISLYMRNLKIGKTGTAFLVSPAGELLAFKEIVDTKAIIAAKEAAAAENKTPGAKPVAQSILKIEEIPHPLLQVTTAAMQKANLSFKDVVKVQHLYFDGMGDARGGYFVTLAPSENNGWVVGTVVPKRDFTEKIEENIKLIWMLVGIIIVIACVFAAVVSQKLFVGPLRQIIGQTKLVKRFELESIRQVETRVSEIDQLSNSVQQMSQGLVSFGKYIPLDLVKTLLAQGMRADISGENRTLSIFFMDLAGFTTISEAMGPKLVPFLGRYLSGMSDVIVKNNGTIDKYIGDAVMAFWGAPLYNEDHAVHCCRAAVECLKQLEVLREEWPEQWRSDLGIRIGVNTGRVIVGNIGSSTRLNYTVLGDPVNLAARLESAGKDYGVYCIIGQSTYDLARYDIVARKLDVVKVKGKHEAVAIYELLAMSDDPRSREYLDWIKEFEQGLAHFLEQEWVEARSCFERTILIRGKDAPSEKFIQRCDAKRNELDLELR